MGPKLFNEFKESIREYCAMNQINADILLRLPKFGKDDYMAFQFVSRTPNGLLDETPAPIVLWVFRDGDTIRCEQTKYTAQYVKSNI